MYHDDRVQTAINFFRSRLTNGISVDTSEARWKYVNRGEATFQGVELEGKYYLNKEVFLQGSALYQTNHDGAGNRNVTPIPNVGVKAGISYEAARGLTAGIFDSYDGALDGYATTLNPGPAAHHPVNVHLRIDVTELWRAHTVGGLRCSSTPTTWRTSRCGWRIGEIPETRFVNRGRTIYFGVELASKRRVVQR